jgi:Leucine-rich repeat (LRR) protein
MQKRTAKIFNIMRKGPIRIDYFCDGCLYIQEYQIGSIGCKLTGKSLSGLTKTGNGISYKWYTRSCIPTPNNCPYLLITELNLSWKHLTELPVLPDTLEYLDCFNNQLIKLPDLPDTLKKLNCHSNQLTELPELPDKLETLWCSYNKLTELPDLPDTLKELHCANNELTELPELPNKLLYLNCENNQLTELPDLPETLVTLYCHDGNKLPYKNLKGYRKWFEKFYPEKVAAKKYNL